MSKILLLVLCMFEVSFACRTHNLTLESAKTHKDVVNATFCGPVYNTSLLQIPPIIHLSASPNQSAQFTVFMYGLGSTMTLHWMVVNASVVGRTLHTGGAHVIQAYRAPGTPGRYKVTVWKQNGTKLDLGSTLYRTDDDMWVTSQQGRILRPAIGIAEFEIARNYTKGGAVGSSPIFPVGSGMFSRNATNHTTVHEIHHHHHNHYVSDNHHGRRNSGGFTKAYPVTIIFVIMSFGLI